MPGSVELAALTDDGVDGGHASPTMDQRREHEREHGKIGVG